MTLRELRKKVGFTQQRLAIELGVSDATVRNWENGRSVPEGTFRLFNRMLNIYGCSWKELCKALEECERLISIKGDAKL